MRKRNHVIPIRLNTKEMKHLETQVAVSGLNREEYLRTLILGAEVRAKPCTHHLVEMNLRSGMEKTFFRADACVSGADFDMTCYLRRGIRYQYHILYQYQ